MKAFFPVLASVLISFAANAASDTGPWIIAPSMELPASNTQGAELRGRAQALAAQKKYDEALPLFEELDRNYPSAEHDCFLALAYLRVSKLTRAQLFWDLGTLRNGNRPDWCAGELPKEIAGQLRAEQYVPLTLSVQPQDAVVDVADLKLQGVPVLWLKQGTYTVTAHSKGKPDAVAYVLVTAPSAQVALNVTDAPIDEAKKTPPSLPPIVVEDHPAEPPPQQLVETAPPAATVERPTWPGWAGIGGGAVALGVGALFHVQAVSARGKAEGEFAGTSAFNAADHDFQQDRAIAVGGYVVSAAAFAFAAYWFTRSDAP